MKKNFWIIISLILSLPLIVPGSLGNAGGVDKPDTSKARCLACHGPYEKLVAKPPFFKGFDPRESKITVVNPHQYWPHEDKTEKGIQECTLCHKPHKENMKAGDSTEKANVERCFGCHHNQTFDRCKACHEN
ncbi:MAG TPA: hypothetical protein VK564_07340 [Thermodesulfobacteriota bacterium]|nr:hypothetical protein [Thermodesulfobacteriota bacterium]